VEVAEDPEERDPAVPAAEGVDGVASRDWHGDEFPSGNSWRGAGREADGDVGADAARRGWRGGWTWPGTSWWGPGLGADDALSLAGADPGGDPVA
jgi:hypothetical protein